MTYLRLSWLILDYPLNLKLINFLSLIDNVEHYHICLLNILMLPINAQRLLMFIPVEYCYINLCMAGDIHSWLNIVIIQLIR